MAPRTILLINFHSTKNAGDLALLEAAIRQLTLAFDVPQVIVSANYPQEKYFIENEIKVVQSPATLIYSRKSLWRQIISWISGILTSYYYAHNLPSIQEKGNLNPWRELASFYISADLVVGCPGNQFLSMGRFGWPIIVSATAVYLAILFKKPLYVMPQSLGPFKRSWERWLMKWLYSSARLVFLRDGVSYKLAQELGLPLDRLIHVPDPAFIAETASKQVCVSLPNIPAIDTSRDYIGVTVIRKLLKTLKGEEIEKYHIGLADALMYMIRKYDTKIVFFPQVTGPTEIEDDRIAAKQVRDRMEDLGDQVYIMEESLSASALRAFYKQIDVMIASRLHSGIFALSVGTPTLFIGYLTKTRGILEDLGMQEWLIELDNFDEGELIQKLEKLWQNRIQVEEEINRRLPSWVEGAEQVGIRIAQDFQSV
jgi:colanic acid/amylovoran biosynthesis protein